MERTVDDHVPVRVGAKRSQPYKGQPAVEAHAGAVWRTEVKGIVAREAIPRRYIFDEPGTIVTQVVPKSAGAVDDCHREGSLNAKQGPRHEQRDRETTGKQNAAELELLGACHTRETVHCTNIAMSQQTSIIRSLK